MHICRYFNKKKKFLSNHHKGNRFILFVRFELDEPNYTVRKSADRRSSEHWKHLWPVAVYTVQENNVFSFIVSVPARGCKAEPYSFICWTRSCASSLWDRFSRWASVAFLWENFIGSLGGQGAYKRCARLMNGGGITRMGGGASRACRI